MTLIEVFILLFLIMCAIGVSLTKNLVTAVFIFSSFSVVASILWLVVQAPDLAITEAAVGAGASTILFLVVLRNMGAIFQQSPQKKEDTDEFIS